MKQTTKKALKNSLLNSLFVLFFAIISFFSASVSQAQGYMGKKNLINYRVGFYPWEFANRNIISNFTHEFGIERVSNRRISYGLETTYGMGERTIIEGIYSFNFIMPSVFFRFHSIKKGSIAPLGLANKFGIGFVSLNYTGNMFAPKSGTGLVFNWSVMKRVPLSKTLLLDYGTGLSLPISTGTFGAMSSTFFSLRLGLGFAIK
jgi:hypothetical protein